MDIKPCATCQAPIEQSRTYCGTACRIEGLRRRNQATTKLADEAAIKREVIDGVTAATLDRAVAAVFLPMVETKQQDDWRRPAGPREAMESWHHKPMNHGR